MVMRSGRRDCAARLPPGARQFDRATAAARAALGEVEFTAVWAAGQALSLEDAITEALADLPPA